METLNKVACGFMFVLVVAFMCGSRPVSGLLNTYLYINNTIAPNTDFTYDCNSTAGNFDEYTLNYMHEWHTKFENFGATTKLWCSMWWTDKNGRQVKGNSDIFIGNRDEERCRYLCKYYAKVDGIYLHNSVKNKLELMYAWPK
ncbi:hypothetical protein FRX31_031738 [Thalictrum thalictroides]|uniref:S-protein homolog n=1 Tax=Thalictrum thalictroides TaxID=46969 RepID=A0A7J6V1H0_THATH|nr:hypothetical protein FRX31_031738 [Thalictrum thalictroides]